MPDPRWQIPDELLNRLLEEIETKGRAHARAKAALDDLRQRLKTTEAVLAGMAESEGIRAHQKQQQYARSHPIYLHLSDRLFQTVVDAETAELELRNAEREYEGWRTISANERSVR